MRRCGVAELETIGMTPDMEEEDYLASSQPPSATVVASVDRRFSIFHSSTDIRPGHWQACIFKVGDDVRQVTTTSLCGRILLLIFCEHCAILLLIFCEHYAILFLIFCEHCAIIVLLFVTAGCLLFTFGS